MHIRLPIALLCLTGVLAGQTADGGPAPGKAVLPSKAEVPELITDRPDFTESTAVVGRGVLQVEDGMTVDRTQGVNTLDGPELLARMGVSRNVELRFGFGGFFLQRLATREKASGRSDAQIGAKIALFGESGRRPAISLIPILSIPVGSAETSSGGYDPTLKIAIGKALPLGFSIGNNINFSSLMTADGRFLQTSLSSSVGHSLWGGFRGYWEIFAFTPWEKGGPAALVADTGLTHAIGPNAQADVRAGRRLTHSGPDWFWGVGMAIRQFDWPLFRALTRSGSARHSRS